MFRNQKRGIFFSCTVVVDSYDYESNTIHYLTGYSKSNTLLVSFHNFIH